MSNMSVWGRLLLVMLVSCAGGNPPTIGATAAAPYSAANRPVAVAPVEPMPTGAARTAPIVLVTDPQALAPLAQRGIELGLRHRGSHDTKTLSLATPFAAIADAVADDITAAKRADRRAGIGMAHAHRLFNPAWLRSEEHRFELVGMSNRIDRLPVTAGHCGEVRWVYRLAYATTAGGLTVDSRVPMTLNIVAFQSGSDCAEVARHWLAPEGLSGEPLATWLSEGPLKRVTQLKSVEVNLQSVRWPSTVHPTMAGHAEYVLRVFRYDGDELKPAPMENMPDVAMLRRHPALRRELLAWLKDQKTLDSGTLLIPDRFLATNAISVAPRGLSRRANRPFTQLFEPAELEGGRQTLRRLDQLSCVGCHQSRSLAGFHLLGAPRKDKRVDALAVEASPHLEEERLRRAAVVSALALHGTVPNSFPVAERIADDGWGAHCSLSDDVFPSWRCADGLECRDVLGGAEIGVCLDDEAVGGPCEVGTVTQRDDPHDDRVGAIERLSCGTSAVCERNKVGFPGGMCSPSCRSGGKDSVCGAIALLVDFNDCLARGSAFEQCVLANSRAAGLRRCDATHPCRDDYVCSLTSSGQGACMPPYFLFQLRVDGHPL